MGLAALACLALTACSPPAEEYLVAITTDSSDAHELYIDGRTQVENLRFAEGRRLFEQALEKDPEFALAHLAMANNATSAQGFFDHLRQAVALADGVSEGERHMILGADAGARGDLAAQYDHYSALVEAFPEDERVQTLLGVYHFGQQDYKEAVARLRRAVSVNPEFAPPYNMLGYAYRFLGQLENAEWAFETYIDRLPSEANPYDSFAEFLMMQGRFTEAVVQYEKALGLDAGFIASRIGIANIHMFEGEFDAARQVLAEALETAADDGQRRQALLWTAASFVHEGDTDGALAKLGEMSAIAEASNDPAAVAGDLNLMGNVLYEAGRLDEATEHYERSLETLEGADVLDEVKEAGRRQHRYNELRVAIERGDLAAAKERAAEYRALVTEADIPAELRQASEVEGLIALAEEDYRAAVRALGRADQQNPRILYLHALAQQGLGSAKRSTTLVENAARFNGLSFDYAYVKRKAEQLLEQ
jgi:tetratricopeptide (TPR) repeat protein